MATNMVETLRDYRISGGAGADQLDGGAGADQFIFTVGFGADTVRDYGSADLIELDVALLGNTAANGTDLLIDYAIMFGTGAQIDFGGGDVLTIDDVDDLSDLTDAFLFF